MVLAGGEVKRSPLRRIILEAVIVAITHDSQDADSSRLKLDAAPLANTPEAELR
jgi:hypothetical protein